ncbi:MAG: UDP-2,3-diacylglucosamine diphosphatase [Oceanospirillales bacterium LUC14_002_19_P2]|nr:MAG: UDP-2,3-diacylglucosamine diphosphatase [Oceanospirillales bacterium LUC14_002_19_P2]
MSSLNPPKWWSLRSLPSLFISDLHLMPERPDVAQAFHGFLQGKALEAESLYILGDFFEYWIGDDAMDSFHIEIAEALLRYTTTGRNVFFMPGNRDFLVGKAFCRKTGATWLDDPTLVTLDETPILLMHGDSLCTLDTSYLRFRRIVRNPLIQWLFNHLPLKTRQRIAEKLRTKSRDAGSEKPISIMDVTPEAVSDIMQAHQTLTLVHGHTHRPATHAVQLDDTPAQRIVLGDWDKDGWYLEFNKGHFNLAHFPIPSL